MADKLSPALFTNVPLQNKVSAAPQGNDETPALPRETVTLGEMPKKEATSASIAATSLERPAANEKRPLSPEVPLTLLFTNDIHGNAEPLTKDGNKIGGLANLGGLIRDERARDPEHTMVLDGGDTTMGAALSDYFRGRPMLDGMNAIGYDVQVLGNHDFDNGVEVLAGRIRDNRAPVLAANLIVKKNDSSLAGMAKPYVMKEFDGVKVAIIGLVTPDSVKMLSYKEDYEAVDAEPPEVSLQRVLPEVKEKGADVIMVLSHLGIEKDREIAAQFKDIGVIVGGHTHTVLQKPEQVGNTVIMQAGTKGEFLGKAELLLERETHGVKVKAYELMPVKEGEIQPDEKVAAVIETYKKQLGDIMARKIGHVESDLTQRDYHVYWEESNLGNAMTDILKEGAGAEIGFLNAGAMRCNLYKGDVTVGSVYSLFPWEQQLAKIDMKGRDIKDVLEQGLT